ncbi:MAG TPA: sodium:solute symporter family protein [Cyclobacteriaceae bacterium]|nr:sodium:solute symporter family protein [Cyclobacteriaceae bacterium]
MHIIDWLILALYFTLLIGIGGWAYLRVHNSADFFTAGGKLPWWLTGVSHHVSGYSGAVFVAYAGVAYTHGFSLYIWWACAVALATLVSAFIIAPRWSKLREKTGIQSPTEYLAIRYNIPTQQMLAWSGVIVKIFDVGAKWAAIAILLHVFAGTSLLTGILLAGCVSMIYSVLGGLWADVLNDFAQFLVQLVAGFTMFFIVLNNLGEGLGGILTLWDRLPESHSNPFNPPYTIAFVMTMIVIDFFSYSGGTWHLATRFMSTSSGKQAKKAAFLSSALYLLWPLVLFFPMFAAPVFLKDLADPTQAYGLIALKFLPVGLIGLVLASLFTNTLSMTSSDSNTISAVITRDIIPQFFPGIRELERKKFLIIARVSTFLFTLATVIIAIYAESFGGVFGLIITWFAAQLGPTSVPMILGLLPWFARSDSRTAIISVICGVAAFVILKIFGPFALTIEVATPLSITLTIYVLMGLLSQRAVPEKAQKLLDSLYKES